MDANEATRIIGVIDNRIKRQTKSFATTETTWAEVCGVASDGKSCSAYLYGDTDNPSQNFRVPMDLAVNVGDKVKVAWNDRGERWVFEVGVASDYKKVSINPNTGEIAVGDGASPPTVVISPSGIAGYATDGELAALQAEVDTHEADPDAHHPTAHTHAEGSDEGGTISPASIEIRSNGGSPFIDFSNDTSVDYDARIIYSPAVYGDEYLRILGKALRLNLAMVVDASGNRFQSPSGHSVSSGDSTLGAIQVYNPDTTAGDAYITFHNPNRFAAHLGIDGLGNLWYGGWSRGAKYNVFHGANHSELYQLAIGTVDVTITAGAASGFSSVGWPFTFAQAPKVLVTQTSLPGSSGNFIPKVNGTTITTTGANIYCYTGNNATVGAAVTVQVTYVAFCKTSSSATG